MKKSLGYHIVTAVLLLVFGGLVMTGHNDLITYVLVGVAGQHMGVDLLPVFKRGQRR